MLSLMTTMPARSLTTTFTSTFDMISGRSIIATNVTAQPFRKRLYSINGCMTKSTTMAQPPHHRAWTNANLDEHGIFHPRLYLGTRANLHPDGRLSSYTSSMVCEDVSSAPRWLTLAHAQRGTKCLQISLNIVEASQSAG